MLLSCLIIPNLAPCLNFTGFYAIALLFGSCFVKGGELTVNGLNAFRKRLTKYCPSEASRTVTVLLSCLLVCFFFSQSGFVNLIAGLRLFLFRLIILGRLSLPDKGVQTLFNSFYNPEQDVFSAVWLSNNKALNAGVYSDVISGDHVLVSYGLISSNQIIRITETTVLPIGSFLYLSSLNVVNGVISSSSGTLNMSQIVP